MTAGLSSASFWSIASAVRYSASASAGLPIVDQADSRAGNGLSADLCGKR